MLSVATSPHGRWVSSRVFCKRLTVCARSCTRLTRSRVRSRHSRWGAGGMSLPWSHPWCNRSAIHSAAHTSVLRPGTALLWCAWTIAHSKWPSRTLDTGFQETPVLSRAIGMQSVAAFQHLRGHRPKTADLLVPLSCCREAHHAGDDHLLLTIDPTAALGNQFHSFPPVSRWDVQRERKANKILLSVRAPPVAWGTATDGGAWSHS